MRRTKTIGKIFGIALVFAMIGTMSGGWTGTALTLGAAPSAPTITSPGSSTEPGPTLSTLTPTLQWTAVSGADYYALAISKYPYGSSNVIYNPQQVYGTSHVVPSSTLVPGEKYRWNMQAHGAGGWSAVSNTLYFQAPPNQPPTCSITANPTSGQAPLTVTFTMSASDSDGSISAWVLDVDGDGNADYSGTGSPPSTETHTYTSPSPTSGYSVVLMVSDNNGATAFDTETVVVGVNSPPTCSLSATTSSGPAPLTVTFTMSASDSDGSITTWVLDPGDGNPSYSGSGSPPSTKSHTYSTPGSYTAILMVSDDKDATASDGRIISVGLSDTTPPTISIVSPSSGQTFATPTITVSGSASDNAGISKVEVKVGAGSWQLASGTTSWSKQVTLSPGSNTIYARATDTSGNIGETSVTVAYSPADTTPPTVSGVSPQNGDTDVAIDAIVTATFSEAMDSSTITTGSFTLAGSGVSGTVTYDPATYTATFTPEAVLAYNHTYTATLSTTITDFAGNPLAEPYTWSFTAEPTPVAKLVITSPLQITPEKDKYYVSDLLTANFTIKNVGNEPLILGKLVVGGRFNDGKLPDGNYPDFSPQSLTLDPGQSHQYEGTLELTEAGSYHFFCAYQTPDGKWNTSVDLGLGLTDGDRVKDITVEFPSGPYISQITRNSGVAGENVTIKGVNFDKVLKVVVVKNIIFIEPGQLGDVGSAKIISTTDTQIVCQVPVLTKLQTEGNRVEVTFGDSNDHPFHGINTVEFTYKEPVLESLSPSFGDAGTEVTLYGQNFGYEQVGLSPLGSWVSPPRSYLTFGATRIDEALRWTNDEIIIKAPSDYGTGLGDAKRVFDALTLIMKLANEGVKGAITFLIAGLINKALPDVKIEWELNEDGSLLLQFFKTAGAIGIEAIPVASIFVDINLIANFDLPVTVTTTGGTSEPSLFRFTKDLSQIHVEDSLIAHLASPGELRIYDSHGRVTGMVNGEVKEEIPDSSYYDGNAVIFSALDSYTYEVVGTDDGTYGLDITFVKDGNATTFSRTNTPIAPAAVHEYSIDWSALSQGGAGVAVHIDSNGDGVFEETKTLRPPVASFTFSPSNISVNEEINFDASQSSAADGEVVSYEWDFGDGNNSTGKIATHAYSMPGEYTVSLVVVDNDGVVSTQSRAIQVAERQGMPTWAWAIIAIGIVTMVVAVLRRRRVAKA
jgi:PKD repeat protein